MSKSATVLLNVKEFIRRKSLSAICRNPIVTRTRRRFGHNQERYVDGGR